MGRGNDEYNCSKRPKNPKKAKKVNSDATDGRTHLRSVFICKKTYRDENAVVISVENAVVVDVAIAGISESIAVHVCLVAVWNLRTIILIVLMSGK